MKSITFNTDDSRVKLAKLSAGIREVLSSSASSDLAWTMLRCCLGKEGLGLSGIADAIDEVLEGKDYAEV